jgi:hypothetical protein
MEKKFVRLILLPIFSVLCSTALLNEGLACGFEVSIFFGVSSSSSNSSAASFISPINLSSSGRKVA